MKLAQDTQDSTLVDDATTLPSPAGVTGTLSSGANVGNGAKCVGDGLAGDGDEILFAGRGLLLLSRTGGGDGDGSWAWHDGLYGHGGRHIDRASGRGIAQVVVRR